jgi:hypothetical protein
MRRIGRFIIGVFLSANIGFVSASETYSSWKSVSFEVMTPGFSKCTTSKYVNVFSGKKNSIVRIAPEIDGLTGIMMPADKVDGYVEIKLEHPSKLIVGIFRDSLNEKSVSAVFTGGILSDVPVLKNGLTVTGMPCVDIYSVRYGKGTFRIDFGSEPFLILGVVKDIKYRSRNVSLPDGRLWTPFIIDGFYDDEPLFEIVGGSDGPVIDEKSAGAEDILGGFEGGACVKIGDTYHMFPTERAGSHGTPDYYDRVKTRIGHWTSRDAINWERKSPIYEASGTYAISHEDNPLNDRRGAIWSYMPVFNKEANRWKGFYLAYTVDRELSPNHSFGRIWRCESLQEGYDGIAGPYRDCGIVMEPGLDSQLWEGRQGVDSFFPYKVGNRWLSLYGGAFPFRKWGDYPAVYDKKWWGVGLAESSSIEGPWVRMDTTINPVISIHPWFLENPIVSVLPNGLLIAIFDGGPDGWGLHLPNMFGYSLSLDGVNWSEAHYFPIETKVRKWWDIMRTPLCLIPEGDGIYTVVYAAICNGRRFHPIATVQLKINDRVLAKRKVELNIQGR